MKKHVTTALLTMIAASIFPGGQQEASSNDQYQFHLNDFTGIHASGAFNIEVKKSAQYSVIVIAGKS